QLDDHRSGNLQVRVVPDILRRGESRAAGTTLIGGAEVDPADDHDGAIGDQHLAVIAIVESEVPPRVQWVGRIELHDLYAGSLKSREEICRSRDGADPVVDEVDADSLLRLRNQQVAKLFAVTADILENVVFQVQVVLRGVDGREHGRKCLHAITQDTHLVACKQRA